MTKSDRFSTKREVKRWIQAGMVMQDVVDSAEIDMSTTTKRVGITSHYQEISVKNNKSEVLTRSGKIVTRPDPARPDPTRPAGPSDPWTTLRCGRQCRDHMSTTTKRVGITSHYITSHYITSHYITSHYIT